MRRAAVAFGALACLAGTGATTPAHADPPLHTEDSFTEITTYPAGEFCDVAVRAVLDFADRAIVFGDPDDPERVLFRIQSTVTYTNLETEATATDDSAFAGTVDEGGTRFTVRGLFESIRDVDGRLVDVTAGLVVLDDTGITKSTPNGLNDYAADVCGALGANPAG